MIEIYNKGSKLVVQDSNKNEITLDKESLEVNLDDFLVSYPGEYEKSGILLEVKEYNDILFYNFLLEAKHIVIITSDSFELKEEILSFFGDVDFLIIKGSKEAANIFENIESKVVIPYGEGKNIFLNTLGQHGEEVENYKVKGDFSLDSTEFVNLK